MNTFYLGPKSKVSIINSDIKTGLRAVVFAAHLYPIFKGQFKGILSNEDIKVFISDLTYKSLEDWAKKNPTDLQRVCKYIKDVADIRSKSDETKINAEAAAIINLVTGGSYGKNIDMSKVKWSKIIFMTDADPDKHYFCAKNIPVRHLGNQVKIILL